MAFLYLSLCVRNYLKIPVKVEPKVFRLNALMTIFYFSVTMMFFASGLFHTELDHSEKVRKQLAGVDYSGVLIMINGGLRPTFT